MTSIDPSVMVARMQAVNSTLSSLGPALEAAASTGEFQAVLDNANAVLSAAANPSTSDSSATDSSATGAASATSSGGASLVPSSSLLGLTDSSSTGTGSGVTGGDVVADAQQYLGVPYQWGGTEPSTGFDCSGLVQHVYGDLGITLPRTSQEQVNVGTPVANLAQAQPGDLVFFEPTSSGPGHVGIYIGNGQMIDAPHTGTDVQVQSVGQPIAIRRVLPTAPSGPSSGSTGPSGAPGSIPANLDVPANLVPLFTSAAAQHGVPASLLAAVAKQESGYNPSAVSPAGAEGIMQLMPSTAAGLGVNALNPAQAIGAGAQLLGSYLQRYNGSVPLALAAYNAGPGAVAQYGGVPPYPETTAYVNNIMSMLGATS
jgi:cell wall-associated NlpC family hydrolase